MDPKEPLNADTITEILLRLPAKSVCRFRCVSKLWLSLTSDPLFLRAHAAAAPAEPSGFYLQHPHKRQAAFYSLNGDGQGHRDPTLSFLDFRGIHPELIDACNGLLLCRLPQEFETKPFVLSVCNPTTREHEVIPSCLYIRRVIIEESLRLAFDPRRSPHYMIFAVVRVMGIDHQLMYKYTSETRSWKLIEVGCCWPMHLSSPVVYWNRSFVWLVGFNMIAALDVEGEKIRNLLLPPHRKWTKFLHLGMSGERLHFIRGVNNFQFEILGMSSESSGWHVLHRVDCDSIRHLFDRYRCNLAAVFIRGDEDKLLLRVQNKIVSCHPQQKMFTVIAPVHPALSGYKIFPLAHSLSPLIVNMIDAPPIQEWVSWKSDHDQLLINMMVDHSHNGKKIKNGFRIGAWREMVRMFNQVTGLIYDVRHLKNRLKSYKREYQTVKKILAIDGFHWVPSDKVVHASDADWQKILTSKPEALVYKRKQVPFEDLKIICASPVRIDIKVSHDTCPRKRKGGQD